MCNVTRHVHNLDWMLVVLYIPDATDSFVCLEKEVKTRQEHSMKLIGRNLQYPASLRTSSGSVRAISIGVEQDFVLVLPEIVSLTKQGRTHNIVS